MLRHFVSVAFSGRSYAGRCADELPLVRFAARMRLDKVETFASRLTGVFGAAFEDLDAAFQSWAFDKRPAHGRGVWVEMMRDGEGW